MALWDAPITPTVTSESKGMTLARIGGLRAESRLISWTLGAGRALDTGEEPVQSTKRSEATVMEAEIV